MNLTNLTQEIALKEGGGYLCAYLQLSFRRGWFAFVVRLVFIPPRFCTLVPIFEVAISYLYFSTVM